MGMVTKLFDDMKRPLHGAGIEAHSFKQFVFVARELIPVFLQSELLPDFCGTEKEKVSSQL